MTIRFLHPDMAIWLLAVPAAAACWLVHVLYKHACRRRAAVPERFAHLSRRSSPLRDVAILTLAALSIGLLVAALTEPQLLRERTEPEYERQALILILDRSVSMRARDILPSRAERALVEIKNFLRRKPDAIERVGLVGFAGSPVILAYLTKDLDNVMFYLDWIADDPTLLYGTDMGGALTSALEVTHRDPTETHKMFLLISDGEDQSGGVAAAVAAVKAEHIRVHCIGIGSPVESLIPVGFEGGRDIFLRDDDGNLLTTRFNETTLRSMAEATGGVYVRTTNGNDLREAIETIARSELRQTGFKTTTEYRDVYTLLLAAAGLTAIGLVAQL
jgi:Ca-activated chloride channel family protein